MTHEKLQKHYDKDREKYGDAVFKYWEWKRRHVCENWRPCGPPHPLWLSDNEYRRKEPPFIPEYFSGLNWRELMDRADLFGQALMFSDNAEDWSGPYALKGIDGRYIYKFKDSKGRWWMYCKTCPETYYPTITIGRAELPRPETKEPKLGTEYYLFDSTDPTDDGICTWKGDKSDFIWLESGCIHLDPDRRQAWADWWDNTIMKEIHK